MDGGLIRLYVILGVFVLLLLVFGKNPSQELMKMRVRNFDEKIEKSLNENRTFGKSGLIDKNASFSVLPGIDQGNQGSPDWMRDPLAARKPDAPGAPKEIPPAAVFVPDAYLRSGERLQFIGSKVYRLDADGTRQPLPDGEYMLTDGKTQLLIRGGERVLE